jgi:uncharacterized protein
MHLPHARDVVALARGLRARGVSVGVGQVEAFAQALGLIEATRRGQVYLAARATLVFRREEFGLFDAAFEAWWAPPAGEAKAQKTPQAPRHDPKAFHTTALKSWMAERAKESDPEVDVSEEVRAASPAELLGRRDFSSLSAAERQALADAMAALRVDLTLRKTRRRAPDRRGDQVDLRRALRTLARLGVVPTLTRRGPRLKRRPLVVLADVSGSMELYSRLVLQFLHGLTRRLGQTETFTFGTRLTRITGALRLTDVVLVVSDGWEVGDVVRLRGELAALRRRAHRLVWLNPMMGSASFQPKASGVMAALEFADDCLPIHNFDSLKALARHLSALPSRPRRQPSLHRS